MTDHDPLRRALAELVPPSPGDIEWGDVLDRADRGGEPPRRRRALALVVAVALGTAVALALAAPWKSGPSLLDRASAAILTPTRGRVLYEEMRLRVTLLPEDVRLARRHGLLNHFPHGLLMEGRMRIWLDGTPPQRFRLLESSQFQAKLPNGHPAPSAPTELGGQIGDIDGLNYDPATQALVPTPFAKPITIAAIDPTALIKNALRDGRAQPAGKTSIDGRPAIKILLTANINGRKETTGAYYVDPKTYQPLRIVLANTGPFGTVTGFPIPALALIQMQTMPAGNGRYTFDFREYQSLPATAPARKAADIQASHPHAQIL